MAEEQVMSQALVLQNENEKMLEKLRHMQLNNLTAKQQSNLRHRRQEFISNFVSLSYSLFGLSKNQLKELSETELKELDKLISHKAWSWAIGQMLFTFCVPFVGWFIGSIAFTENEFKSWVYLCRRKYLIKNFGNDRIFEKLKQSILTEF